MHALKELIIGLIACSMHHRGFVHFRRGASYMADLWPSEARNNYDKLPFICLPKSS